MDTRRISRFFLAISVLFASIFAFLFCFGSSKTLGQWGGLHSERLQHYLPFLLLLAGAGSAFGFLLTVVFQIQRNDVRAWSLNLTESRPGQSATWRWLPLGGALLVFLVALSQLSAPLHWEDLFHLSNIVNSPWERFNPLIKTEHHTLASMATYASVKAFGMHHWSVLLPAYLFAAGYLLVLLRLTRHFVSTLGATVLFLHLACNQMAVWYLHSMRGYCLAMLLCSAVLYVLWRVAEGAAENLARDRVLFVLISLAATFTHLFAALFVMIAVVSLVTWVTLNRSSIEGWRARNIQILILDFVFFTLPIYGFIIFFQVLWLERLGDFFKGGFPDITGTLLRTFGTSFVWSGKALLVLAVIVCVSRISRMITASTQRRCRFLSVLIVMLSLFMFTAMRVLEVRLLETRFILPFLAPFVIWLVEGVAEISNPLARYATLAVAVVGLIFSPAISRSGVYEYLSANVRDYDNFMQLVRKRTSPVAQNCYTFSGEPNLIYFSQSLYFGSLQGMNTPKEDCKKNYHLYFAFPSNLEPGDTRRDEPAASYHRVAGIGNSMLLFEKRFLKKDLLGLNDGLYN